MRFERHPSRVAFDPVSSSFVVTWTKCGVPAAERLSARRAPAYWIPSVGAVVELCDRGCVPPGWIFAAATAVGTAFDAGDRNGLDTDAARKAAELVRDLASVLRDSSDPSTGMDIGLAMRRLMDAMAEVRFRNADSSEFAEDASAPVERAVGECFAVPGSSAWTSSSFRRRVLFGLRRRERTEVAYTLVSLLCDTGSCPLLSARDRCLLRAQAYAASGIGGKFTHETASSFLRFALGRMREAKSRGLSRLGERITQQQMADSAR